MDKGQAFNPLHPDPDTYVCPRCGHTGTKLDFPPLARDEEHLEHTVPVRKCRECRHVFALKEN